jgi:preprotein translocase subunit YajC
MDILIPSAYAQAAGGEPSLLATLFPLILIFVIFWFLLIRPQMKRTKQHRELVAALSVGDEVVTAGGVLGRITQLGDSFVTVSVDDKVSLKIQRQSVSQVVPKGTFDQAG